MSILIGYLQYRKDPKRVWRAYSFASFANMEEYDFVCFTPDGIHIKNGKIEGEVFEKGNWVKKITRLPDAIYYEPDPMYEENYESVDQLKQLVPFTSHPIGNKLNLFRKIKEGRVFAEYVIPFEGVRHKEDVIIFLNRYGKIVLKPAWDEQGREVIFIHKEQDDYIVEMNGQLRKYTRDQFNDWITKLADQKEYMIQKYIAGLTKDGCKYDFRLYTQKNREANWFTLSTVPRVARPDRILTNIHSGGLTGIPISFLRSQFGNESYDIEKFLEHFGVSFSQHIEELNGVSYDELGIDIGIDENKKIWIYDVNCKVDEPPFESFVINIIKNAVRYAGYLAKQNKMAK